MTASNSVIPGGLHPLLSYRYPACDCRCSHGILPRFLSLSYSGLQHPLSECPTESLFDRSNSSPSGISIMASITHACPDASLSVAPVRLPDQLEHVLVHPMESARLSRCSRRPRLLICSASEPLEHGHAKGKQQLPPPKRKRPHTLSLISSFVAL